VAQTRHFKSKAAAREFRKRSEAAKRGWEKRRRREAREARERRERALRGWETRRTKQRTRVRAAKKAAKTREFRKARERAAPGLHGSDRGDWHVLRAMIENRDKRWLEFYALAMKLGKTDKQARDEWFSPKV